VKIPIIGIGGIQSAEDAIEFLLVGATAVQLGTINFIDAGAGVRIAEEIREFAVNEKLDDVGKLVGALDANIKHSVLQSWL
jgi:dihydroorotate dehydrogenase (NAD+) catalytic subunit